MNENKVIITELDEVLLTTSMLAKILNTSPKSIAAWHKAGMPKVKTGWWNIADVLEWRGTSTNTGDVSDEARKSKADADYRESKAEKESISLAVLKSEYISKEEVDRQWTVVGTTMKTNLMLWTKTLAPELAHLDMRSVEKVLSDAVYDLLEQLSSKSCWKKSKKK